MKNIYIILSQTGTLFSKAIQWHTKDPYNHASISFDENLEDMYSFGRKRRYNPMDTGLIQENFERGLFPYFPNARCCILEISVTEEEYNVMHETVQEFYRSKEDYRYNLIGVLTFSIGRGFSRKDHFFCSQFVSYIISNMSNWSSNPKLTKPMDFLKVPNTKVIYEGSITEYIIYRTAVEALKVS